MRSLFIVFIVLQTFIAAGQEAKDPSPKILLLDTTISLAPAFNAVVMKYAPGYHLIGSEKADGQRVIYSFTDGRESTLRTEYKYTVEGGKQIVIYQSVTADIEVIIPVFNGLFGTNMAADIDHASMIGGPIQYHNSTYQCMMQADDYRPGYWVLSFVK